MYETQRKVALMVLRLKKMNWFNQNAFILFLFMIKQFLSILNECYHSYFAVLLFFMNFETQITDSPK